ncbi:MAG: cytochrome c oxidase subunit I [Gemmatimonadetes bacterium]|nr:cytochrome c oxidase subunit I [Gemmatimonadota bacterium]
MATTAAPAPVGSQAAGAYAGAGAQSGLWSWLATTDHKRIGTLYLWTALGFLFVGGIEAFIMRLQLMGPNGKLVSAEMYNQLFTMHGTTMVFLVIMPLSAAFFNHLIPLQIGARDVAFPRLNAFSYWVYLFGGLFMTLPIFFKVAPDGGWFGYAPLTTRQFSAGLNIDFWLLGLQILGISSLAAAFNFITTIINMRTPGMTLMRMPIFTWMSFVVQFLLVLAFPAITIALFFLQFDRFFGTQFYEIAAGADPLLWQHLFWVFGHPEVYILILPAFGLASEILPTFSKKPLFGYNVMVYSGIMIGFLGFGVWAHHMFAVGMGATADAIFSMATMLIGIPTGVKIFNWIATMWGGQIKFTVAMKFAIALVGLFTIGGISGVMHSSPPTDLQQTDTYFIVAHFHYVLFGGSIMGIMGGIYFYYPKMTGRFMSETLGNLHFWLFFIGMNLTFFPMHYAGMLGMPRRIYTYDAGQGWDFFNWLSTIGVFFQGAGLLIFAYNFLKSRKGGEQAPNDPWGAGTLEWSIPSPPPDYNFAKYPIVTSRYPMWDLKNPALTADIGHSNADPALIAAAQAVPIHEQTDTRSAQALGIPMPIATIKPLVTALFMVVMFGGLIFIHLDMMPLALAVIIGGGGAMIASLYAWLTSPLE